MSEGWQTLIVKEFSRLTAGGTPSTSKMEYWSNGTIPWLSSGEVHKKRVRYADGYITEDGLKNSAAKLIPIKTLLVALAGQGKTRGTVAITEIETTTNQSIAGIIADKEICHPDYLFFNLDSRYDELRSISGGSGRAGLNLEILGNIDVSLPPLPEQKKIAAILSLWDEAIEKLEKHRSAMILQKRGLMQKLLKTPSDAPSGWKIQKVGALLSSIDGGTSVNASSANASEGEYGVLKTSAITYGRFDYRENKVVLSKEEIIRLKEPVKSDTIIFNRANTPKLVGATAFISKSRPNLYLPDKLWSLKPTEDIHPRWLSHYLNFLFLTGVFERLATGTSSSMTNISKATLRNIRVCFPSINEQQRVSEILSLSDEAIEKLEKLKIAIEKQKRGLMQKLLTGDWRVTLEPEVTEEVSEMKV